MSLTGLAKQLQAVCPFVAPVILVQQRQPTLSNRAGHQQKPTAYRPSDSSGGSVHDQRQQRQQLQPSRLQQHPQQPSNHSATASLQVYAAKG
jgi:hypothetical protein